MLTMYAIANCDTVKKARKHLDAKKIQYEFYDFKKTPPTKELIKSWSEFLGELPINKKGLTYKKYKEEFENLPEKEKVLFLIEQSSMIKRPIVMSQSKVLAVGYDEEIYDEMKKG